MKITTTKTYPPAVQEHLDYLEMMRKLYWKEIVGDPYPQQCRPETLRTRLQAYDNATRDIMASMVKLEAFATITMTYTMEEGDAWPPSISLPLHK